MNPNDNIWQAEKKETWRDIAIVIGLAVVLVAGSFFFDFKDVNAVVQKAGIYAPLVLIALKISTIVFAPLSGAPLYPLAGAFFGTWFGMLYVIIGDVLGSSISFWISRRYGQSIVMRFLSKSNMTFLSAALEYMGTLKGLVIARVLFSPMPEVVSYGAGLTKLKFWPFIFIHSAIGLIPTILLVGFGASLTIVQGSWGMVVIIVIGAIAAGIGGWIFLKFIQPKLSQQHDSSHSEATNTSA